ncbi:PREDICTED: taste receptor type 2 member 3-like [Nanorana parkeri]|uniref:taste receptor type 2 member 3-like n=1 Tax=Nanorana parkeri TaxID=125878 RepID=UPI0008542468|nr:PREDICTED: taste receptor type 2 member 3-like [Nanorana parkeri]
MASLGLVRIIHLMIYTFKNVVMISSELYNLVKVYADYIVTMLVFAELCSLWWGTVLCVFYCVKINNYSSRLFIKVKMRISGMVPWLLLGSLMASCLSSLPYEWFVYSLVKENSTQIRNRTITEDVALHSNTVSFFIIYIVGSFVPFLIFCVATFFLVVPLFKHTRNMSHNNTGFTQGQLDVLLSAIRNMLSFLIFYILYFITGILFPVSVQLQDLIFGLVCCIFQVAYPSLHSVVLIISNVKLKQSVIDVLHCLK